MTNLIDDFNDRKRQVRHYVAIVANAEGSAEGRRITRVQEQRLLTLRSGTFLVLYNMVEASIRMAIEQIHDAIIQDNTSFESLNESLRKEVLRLFRADTRTEIYKNPVNFPSALVAAALGPEFKIGGNVDARSIRELGKLYGFSTETDRDITWNGSDLLTVKSNRNDLSHGRKSYEEVGRYYTLRDLMHITRRVTIYTRCILNNIDEFIAEDGYCE